jgi:hypothetical protein
MVAEACRLSPLYDPFFPYNPHDLLWRKLFFRRNAFLCLKKIWRFRQKMLPLHAETEKVNGQQGYFR